MSSNFVAVGSFSGSADAKIAGIAAIDENNSQTELINILGDICKEIRKTLKVPVTIGIGHSAPRLLQRTKFDYYNIIVFRSLFNSRRKRKPFRRKPDTKKTGLRGDRLFRTLC